MGYASFKMIPVLPSVYVNIIVLDSITFYTIPSWVKVNAAKVTPTVITINSKIIPKTMV